MILSRVGGEMERESEDSPTALMVVYCTDEENDTFCTDFDRIV